MLHDGLIDRLANRRKERLVNRSGGRSRACDAKPAEQQATEKSGKMHSMDLSTMPRGDSTVHFSAATGSESTPMPSPGPARRPPGSSAFLTFRFVLVKVWQLETAPFLDPGHPDLWPLAPLTRDGVDCVPQADRLILKSKLSPLRRGNIATVFAILLGLRNKAASRKFTTHHRHVMIESPTYQLIQDIGRKEGRKEGRAKGRVEGRVETLLRLLEIRFGRIPPTVRAKVARTTSLGRCNRLLKHAVACSSIGEFKAAL
jgi:hypothetical protein